jgi:hypothetical protein
VCNGPANAAADRLPPGSYLDSCLGCVFDAAGAGACGSAERAARGSKTHTWQKCVAWAKTSPGKHDDWCRRDVGPSFRHVGQDTAGCKEGYGKGVCEEEGAGGGKCEKRGVLKCSHCLSARRAQLATELDCFGDVGCTRCPHGVGNCDGTLVCA